MMVLTGAEQYFLSDQREENLGLSLYSFLRIKKNSVLDQQEVLYKPQE